MQHTIDNDEIPAASNLLNLFNNVSLNYFNI